MAEPRKSIEPTYDSRQTGTRYYVTYEIGDRTVAFQQPIADPFVRATLRISWLDRLKSLLRRDMTVTVVVGGDREVVEDVLELDANYLGPGNSTRRQEWNRDLGKALVRSVKEAEAAEDAPAPTERKHPAVSTENPISDLVNAALNGGDTPDDGSEHRPELASAYNLLYGTPVLVELVTGEAQRPTMGTAIRIVNALADAGLLNVAGGRSGDR